MGGGKLIEWMDEWVVAWRTFRVRIQDFIRIQKPESHGSDLVRRACSAVGHRNQDPSTSTAHQIPTSLNSRAVLQGEKRKGLVTPRETKVHGDALCWSRHGQDTAPQKQY